MTNKAVRFDAYMTVYLSLIFTIVLSLLLSLIDGAAIGVLRTQSELVADLGMDSALAEYNREILKQYGLLFVDTAYGDANGGTGELREHIKDYINYNITLNEEYGNTLLALANPQLEIQEVSYASDDNGVVWKAQAIDYMKAVYGKNIISCVKNDIAVVADNDLVSRNLKDEISAQKQEFEDILREKNIIEYNAESEDGHSYEKLSDLFDDLISEGMLSLVMPEGGTVSNRHTEGNKYLSKRKAEGVINKGSGLQKDVDEPVGIEDELIYGEYLIKHYGSYVRPKKEGQLCYQIEYILYGNDSDVSNLRAFAERLFALRSVSNFIYLNDDGFKKAEIQAVATMLCTLLCVPELTDTLTNIVLGIWAMAEAVVDVRTILTGGKIPLIKNSESWYLSLGSLFTGRIFESGGSSEGVDYEGYLRIFLGLMNTEEKAVRSLDIVEMDVRRAEANTGFRIDRCIDYMKVNFGFTDADGHDFVFSRAACY